MPATDAFDRNEVTGGIVRRLFFSLFQPVVLFATIAFWIFAPDAWATPDVALASGIALRAACLLLERVSERHSAWRLTWKELTTDLFLVSITYTLVNFTPFVALAKFIMSKAGYATHHATASVTLTEVQARTFPEIVNGAPLFVLQVFLTMFLMDLGQYCLHRAMHTWRPLWLIHAPHHFVTQLNTLKVAAGNPLAVYMAAGTNMVAVLVLGHLLGFGPRPVLAAGAIAMSVSVYQHANIRFHTPRWWLFLFNTIEHHSLHHSRDYQSTRCNYAITFILIDRLLGTCIDAEADQVGQEGGRRMSIVEQMLYPVRPLAQRAMAPFRRKKSANAQ